MPEGVEIEIYRRAAEAAVGRHIRTVEAPDAWYLKRATTADALTASLTGRPIAGARRRGKLLLLDTDGPVLGLRFGMTGRLVIDGIPSVAELEYGSHRLDRAWDRLVICFAEGGELRVNDARRLGAVELDPDELALGPDAFEVSEAGLGRLLGASIAPLKARLMDQSRIAGVGNLIADEVLWRASLDPARAAGSLRPDEVRRLHRALRRVLADLLAAGGSHTGPLQPERRPGGRCPRDATPLLRRVVGGRTTYSCPRHQR